MRCSVARLVAALAAAMLAAGCGTPSFACLQDGDCANGGASGTCEADGGCSFPDETCDSGKRYGEHAPNGLGGSCVPVGLGSESSSSTMGSTLSSTTVLDGTLGTSDGSSSTGITTLTTTTTDPSETTASTSESEGGPQDSTGDGPAMFFDAFDRPDADAVGNGWIEKTPGAFGIQDETVVLATENGNEFRDNLCYRPFDEALLDVEVTHVFGFVAGEGTGFPQIHMRVQESSVADAGMLDSYVVFLNHEDVMAPRLTVARIAGTEFGVFQHLSLDVIPTAGEAYRLRGRVTGTDPVLVEGWLERDAGGSWEVIAEETLEDAAMNRLVTAGSVAFSGHVALENLVLDDFGYTELP